MNRLVIAVIAALLLVPSVFAADPGHSAAAVGPGVFEGGGNYSFPDSNFSVGTGLFVNTVTGYVGLGTTTPAYALDINGGASDTRIRLLSGNANNLADLRIGRTAVEGYFGIAGSAGHFVDEAVPGDLVVRSDSSLLLGSGGSTTRVAINGTTGNVGIGTETPTSTFHVVGDLRSQIAGDTADYSTFSQNTAGLTIAANRKNITINAAASSAGMGNIHLQTLGNTRMTITNNSFVGIGTTNPQSLMHIASDNYQYHLILDRRADPNIDQLIYLAPSYVSAGETRLDINIGDTGRQMVITESGNVGVGTASPQVNLQVDGTNSRVVVRETGGLVPQFILADDAGGGAYGDSDNAYKLTSLADFSQFQIRYGTVGSTTAGIVLTNSGLVGIGTTAPNTQLHLVGTGTTNQVIIENTDADTSSAPDFALYRNSSSPANADALGRFDFRGQDSAGNEEAYAYIYSSIGTVTSGSEDGLLRFVTKDGGADVETLTLNAGNVGIGTTSPSHTFNVVGDANISDTATDVYIATTSTGSPNLRLQGIRGGSTGADIGRIHGHWDGNTVTEIRFLSGVDGSNKDDGQIAFHTSPSGSTVIERMRIDENGNVGIGSNDPSSGLHINGTADTPRVMLQQSGTGGATWSLISADDATHGSNTDGDLLFYDGGANVLTLDSAANSVGINTTTPTQTLNTIGDANITGRLWVNDAEITATGDSTNLTATANLSVDGSTLFVDGSTGRVGIGTSAPTAPLQVTYNDNSPNILVRSEDTNPTISFYNPGASAKQFTIGVNDSTDSFVISEGSSLGNSDRLVVDSTGNVSVDNNVLYVDALHNRVGVGTTNPLQTLSVVAGAGTTAIFNVGAEGDFYGSWMGGGQDNNPTAWVGDWYSQGGGLTWNSSTDRLQLQTYNNANDEIAIAPSGGLVGIGTFSPSQALTVAKDDGVTAGEHFIANIARFYNGYGLYLGYLADGTTVTSGLLRADSNLNLSLGTSSHNQTLVITDSGRVGIGTTNPGEKLSIEGSGSANENVLRVNNQGPWASRIWLRTQSQSAYLGISDPSTADTVSEGLLGGALHLGVSNTMPIQFWNKDTGGENTVKMTILNSGNVGINTTDPLAALHVKGNVAVNTSPSSTFAGGSVTSKDGFIDKRGNNENWFYGSGDNLIIEGSNTGGTYGEIRFKTSNAESAKIDTSGNFSVDTDTLFVDALNERVGIGTPNPTSGLHVSGNSYVTGRMGVGVNIENEAELFGVGGSVSGDWALTASNSHSGGYGAYIRGGGASSNALQVFDYTGANTLMVVRGTGLVGIGTAEPATKLSVVSDSATTGSGTSNVDQLLNSDFVAFIKNNRTGGDYGGLRIDMNVSGVTTNDWPLNVRYGDSSLLSVRGDGTVGINETTPANALTVQGDISVSSGDRICWDGETCSRYTYYNGTCIITVGATSQLEVC